MPKGRVKKKTANYPHPHIHISTSGFKATTFHSHNFSKSNAISRPSKCPKYYMNSILGEQNLRQKVQKFDQNLNFDKMMYLLNIL